MQIKNPDSLITFEKINPEKMLSNYAECAHGLAPGDTKHILDCFGKQTCLQMGITWPQLHNKIAICIRVRQK